PTPKRHTPQTNSLILSGAISSSGTPELIMASESLNVATKHAGQEPRHPSDGSGRVHQHHDDQHEQQEQNHAAAWRDAARIAFVGFAILAVWFRVWEPFAKMS